MPKSLSVQVLQVPECPSAQVPEFPRMQMPWVPKYLSALWVPERLECQSTPWALECPSDLRVAECPSAQIPFKYPWNAHWRPSFSLSALRAKKVWNITRNGLGNSFIEFLKTFQNTYFYEALIVFSFLRNKMDKLYHILLAGCNHLKVFQKLSLNIL